MQYPTKELTLKNQQTAILRHATVEDANDYIEFLKDIASETEHIVRYPEEVNISLEQEQTFLQSMETNPDAIQLAVYYNNQLVGSASFSCLRNSYKLRHRAEVGISIKKDYWNLGIGTQLLQEIISLAIKHGFEQLELEVSSENTRAISLYQKIGFIECGRIPHGFKLKNNRYADLIMMILPLKSSC